MPRNLVHSRLGGAHVLLVHGAEAPTDAEWAGFLRACEGWMSEVIGYLVVTDGGGLTGSQRRALREVVERHAGTPFRTAVVSSSLLVRGIANAIHLFNPRIQAFGPHALAEALAYIRAPGVDPRACLAEVELLRGRLREP